MQCNGFIILKYLANIASLYEDDLYTKLEKYERKSIEQNNQIIFFLQKEHPVIFKLLLSVMLIIFAWSINTEWKITMLKHITHYGYAITGSVIINQKGLLVCVCLWACDYYHVVKKLLC